MLEKHGLDVLAEVQLENKYLVIVLTYLQGPLSQHMNGLHFTAREMSEKITELVSGGSKRDFYFSLIKIELIHLYRSYNYKQFMAV